MKKYFIAVALLCGPVLGLLGQSTMVPRFQLQIKPQAQIYFQANDSVLNPFDSLAAMDSVNIGVSALLLVEALPDSIHILLSDDNGVFWTGSFTDLQSFQSIDPAYILFNPALVTTPYGGGYFSCTAYFFREEQVDIITRTFNNQ